MLTIPETIQMKGLQPIKDILRRMGGWPVLEGSAWDPSGFEWTHNIYINRQLGYSLDYIVDFSVTTNIKNSSWRVIDVGVSIYGFPLANINCFPSPVWLI